MHSMQLCILLFSCRHTDTRNDFLHTTQHIRIIMGEIIWNRSFDSDIHKLFLQIGTICASQTISIQSSTGFRCSTLKRQISAFQLLVAQQLYKMISVIDIWINNREIQYSNVQHITYPPFKTKTWIFWGQLVEPQALLTLLPIHLDSFSKYWFNSWNPFLNLGLILTACWNGKDCCLSQYLLNSTKMTTNTETAMLSMFVCWQAGQDWIDGGASERPEAETRRGPKIIWPLVRS